MATNVAKDILNVDFIEEERVIHTVTDGWLSVPVEVLQGVMALMLSSAMLMVTF